MRAKALCHSSSSSSYVAAGLGGAVNGAIAASGGYWYGPAAGFVGGGVQSSVSQSADILNGSSNTFSASDVFTSGVSQGAYGLLPGLRIKGITANRNSFEAIGKSVPRYGSIANLPPHSKKSCTQHR